MHPSITSTSTALLTLLTLLPSLTLQHGHQVPVADDADWATRHMAEEHHIANMDPSAFFSLHDYDKSESWTPDEVRRTYGLDDESAKNIDEGKKQDVVRVVMDLFDQNKDGGISRQEFVEAWMGAEAKRLPDFGTGPGHHGDDEYEYEIHHFEKFHDENTREEDLIHPEDIEHFRKHDEMDAAAERQAQLDRMQIVEGNIPEKFLRRH